LCKSRCYCSSHCDCPGCLLEDGCPASCLVADQREATPSRLLPDLLGPRLLWGGSPSTAQKHQVQEMPDAGRERRKGCLQGLGGGEGRGAPCHRPSGCGHRGWRWRVGARGAICTPLSGPCPQLLASKGVLPHPPHPPPAPLLRCPQTWQPTGSVCEQRPAAHHQVALIADARPGDPGDVPGPEFYSQWEAETQRLWGP
jgi:hypothetical protein